MSKQCLNTVCTKHKECIDKQADKHKTQPGWGLPVDQIDKRRFPLQERDYIQLLIFPLLLGLCITTVIIGVTS